MPKENVTAEHLKSLKVQEAENKMQHDLDRLLELCPSDEIEKYRELFRNFMTLFKRFLLKSEKVQWQEIRSLPPEYLIDYNSFNNPGKDIIKGMLDKLVVVKLNGGLGTTMKCMGPKSLIPVRNGLTFLDLTIQQIENLNTEYETNVPLVLMNSFNTKDAIGDTLKKYRNLNIKIYTFMQDKYPHINAENFEPLPKSFENDESFWYPPGHGNFYESFSRSGLIKKFQEEGRQLCFVSNIDNLGATVDFAILNFMLNNSKSNGPDFLMEVTHKTPADVKGGTLVLHNEKIRLLEYAEVPYEHLDEFKGARKFKYFNTNNLWMKLEPIINLTTNNELVLGVIENKKRMASERGIFDVIQLETPIGAAIQSFPGALGVAVPRSRFLPVKSTSDLFLLRSNVYILKDGKIVMNPQRSFPSAPLVRLGDEHFGDYRDIDKRFAKIPDCIDLHHLTVSGDVTFGKDVSFSGNVTIIANHKERIDIPQGSELQGKIVTGCLRIVDY
ncbi:UTP--glucose-1-phosphate uridylyltransferase-like [Argiope bruennichi]|uniref:UTP--glucose-1-phosphate uridylyltransferase n=1 Tax=Argiope bruennichi TaxID=94029 RepID=A0A8T0FUZ8_ARGBR|nr:UTP--glucose-1-phosphate uridylyltransferase-like [Argiope bruennichi]KAF8794522.1 UTP--glucose-1-phosphate uridylyltransferase like protein [Argiope bruennichi]